MVSHTKRRKHFVDPAVQGALARRMAYHWFSFLVVSSALSIGLQALTDPFQPLTIHLAAFAQKHVCFLVVLVCMTPIYLWDAVKLSNRFVGPIMRLRRALRDLNNGKPVRQLKFRPGDFWSGLADDFNGLLRRQNTVEPVGADTNARERCELASAGASES
jgi:hypothetical protein